MGISNLFWGIENPEQESDPSIQLQPAGQPGVRASAKIQRQCAHHQQYRGGSHDGQGGIQFEGMAEAGEDKRHRQHSKQGGQGIPPQVYGSYAGCIADQCKREQR